MHAPYFELAQPQHRAVLASSAAANILMFGWKRYYKAVSVQTYIGTLNKELILH